MLLTVLFVCTGNTCRSPIAAALLRAAAERADLPFAIKAASAGLAARPGTPASKLAITLLAEEGIDLSSHQAVPVSEEVLSEADLVLVMSADQLTALRVRYPQYTQQAALLKSHVGLSTGDLDIADPFGGEHEKYKIALEEIRESIKKLMKIFREGNDENSPR